MWGFHCIWLDFRRLYLHAVILHSQGTGIMQYRDHSAVTSYFSLGVLPSLASTVQLLWYIKVAEKIYDFLPFEVAFTACKFLLCPFTHLPVQSALPQLIFVDFHLPLFLRLLQMYIGIKGSMWRSPQEPHQECGSTPRGGSHMFTELQYESQ